MWLFVFKKILQDCFSSIKKLIKPEPIKGTLERELFEDQFIRDSKKNELQNLEKEEKTNIWYQELIVCMSECLKTKVIETRIAVLNL